MFFLNSYHGTRLPPSRTVEGAGDLSDFYSSVQLYRGQLTGGRRNSVPVGVETNVPFSREPLRVVRADRWAAWRAWGCVPPCHSARTTRRQLVHDFFYPL